MKKIINIIAGLIAIYIIVIFIYAYYVPARYDDLIEKYTQEYGVDKSLIKAMILKESRFRKDAISNKGATGLMQIMPATGEWIAKKLNFEKYSLENSDDNIRFGVYYMSYLLKIFNQNKDHAIIAYNAGMGNVKAWINSDDYDREKFIQNIPFGETKNYIKKVNNYMTIINFIESFGIGYRQISNFIDKNIKNIN